MKSIFTKPFSLSLLVASGLLFAVSSCSKVEDLYKAPEGESSELIPDLKVSDKFNWSTTKNVDVRFAVDDQFDGRHFYKVELFDREPQAAGAVLLDAGIAKKGEDLVTEVTIPTSLSYIYVQVTTPRGEVSYTMLAVNTTESNVSKVASVKVGGVTRLASTTAPSATPTFTRTVEPAKPSVSPSNQLSGGASFTSTANNGIYVIEAGQTLSGNIDLANGKSGIVVYVKGTWNVPSQTITVENTNKIIVLNGGKINANSVALKQTAKLVNYGTIDLRTLAMHNSGVVVENYGQLTVANNTGELNGSFYNLGTLDAKGDYSVTADPSHLYNEGTVKIGGTISLASKASFLNYGVAEVAKMTTANDNIVSNYGNMTIDIAELNNVQFFANCFTKVNNMSVTGANQLPKINVATDAKLEIGTLNSGSAIYNLQAGGILKVTGKATFSTSRNTILGLAGAKKAIATIGEVVSGGWEAITYSGNLEVATAKHTANDSPYDKKYVVVDGAFLKTTSIVPNAFIAGTTCNAGGVGTGNPTPPVDQILDKVVLGYHSFAFEDNWPLTGDYDMNDFVVDVQMEQYKNLQNKIEKIVLRNKVRSVGASKRLSAAIQLDNVLATAVRNVVYSVPGVVGRALPLAANNIESGQTKAVVTIVDDAHRAFGIENTAFIFTHDGSRQPFMTEITITFNTPIESITYQDLNPFIISTNNSAAGRYEVHLVGRSGTDKINRMLLNRAQSQGGTLSSTDPFKFRSNVPFALNLPLSFQYPNEGQNISSVYPDLETWIASEGRLAEDWYIKK